MPSHSWFVRLKQLLGNYPGRYLFDGLGYTGRAGVDFNQALVAK